MNSDNDPLEARSGGSNLGDSFSGIFELTVAQSPSELDEVFRIRHEVYCRDLGWEPLRPDGRETDEFDSHSYHCLLRRRGSHTPVGCTRLIVGRPGAMEQPLPFELACKDVLDRTIADPARLPRATLGEVSRLAVLRTFRQRKGDEVAMPASISADDFSDDDVSKLGRFARFPFIPVGLYLGVAAVARRLGIEHVFVLTEPRLAEHFARIGFDIHPVGGAIEHRGTRVPSLLSSSKVVAGLRPMIKPLYAVIEAEVDAALGPKPLLPDSPRVR